jgi:hypothetical protein
MWEDKTGFSRWHHPEMTAAWRTYYLKDSAVDRPHSLLATAFRRKFRVPKPVFDEIYDASRAAFPELDEVQWRGRGMLGHPPKSLQLKILAVLRVLALGCAIEAVEEASGISRPVLNMFIHKWLDWFVKHYAPIHMPGLNDPEEVAKAERTFACCGLPGCVTSMDGVHIAWERCPATKRPMYSGKEGYPTVAFNVHVTHNKKIVSVSGPYPGACYLYTHHSLCMRRSTFVV